MHPNKFQIEYFFQGHGQSGVINDIALSKFHVLTMHQNAIVATCLLNNQLVFSDEFDRKDPILGFRQNSTEGKDSQTVRSGYIYSWKISGKVSNEIGKNEVGKF